MEQLFHRVLRSPWSKPLGRVSKYERGASLPELLITILFVGLVALVLLPELSRSIEKHLSYVAYTVHHGGGTTGTTARSLEDYCEQQSLILPPDRDPEFALFCRWYEIGSTTRGGGGDGSNGAGSGGAPPTRIPPE